MMPLSSYERAHMTCEELDGEIADCEAFKERCDGRTPPVSAALGALGDLGIGNAMERMEAKASADERIESCEQLKRDKGCATAKPPRPPPVRWRDRSDVVQRVYHDNEACPVGGAVPIERRATNISGLFRCGKCSLLAQSEN